MGVWFSPSPLGYDQPLTIERLKYPLGNIVAFTFFWTALYILVLKIWKTEAEWTSRIIAGLHAIVVVSLSLLLTHDGPNTFTDPGVPNTYREELLVCLCLGYFIYDYGWIVYNRYEERFNIITMHHLGTIVALLIVVVKGSSATETIAGLIFFELTNPLLQARWLLRAAGYKGSTVFTIVDLSFIVSFVLCRFFWLSYFAYTVCSHPRPGLDVKLCTLWLCVVSWYLLAKVGKYAYRQYVSASEDQEDRSR